MVLMVQLIRLTMKVVEIVGKYDGNCCDGTLISNLREPER